MQCALFICHVWSREKKEKKDEQCVKRANGKENAGKKKESKIFFNREFNSYF